MVDFHFRDMPLAVIWSLDSKEGGKTVRKLSQESGKQWRGSQLKGNGSRVGEVGGIQRQKWQDLAFDCIWGLCVCGFLKCVHVYVCVGEKAYGWLCLCVHEWCMCMFFMCVHVYVCAHMCKRESMCLVCVCMFVLCVYVTEVMLMRISKD